MIFESIEASFGIETFNRELEAAGVHALIFGGRFMRMVTHLDITHDDMEHLEGILSRVPGS